VSRLGAAVRWSLSLGAWTRHEALLTSALAVGAGLAALSEPLHAAWLVPAGAFVAAGGAVSRFGIAAFRGRLEGARERTEALRRLRVPVTAVTDVDATLIGIDPAAQDLLPGSGAGGAAAHAVRTWSGPVPGWGPA
jgi:hypothetical protein